MTTPRRPLPRSLEPLADESLPGYLLRLAHRLDLSPARLDEVTGLTLNAGVPVSRMLALEPAMAEEFGRMTRLSATEVTTLTLACHSGSYPPLDLAFSGRRRLIQGVFVKENWVFSHASRYCPRCLAGDGSVIQGAARWGVEGSGDCPSSSPARPTVSCFDMPVPPAATLLIRARGAGPCCRSWGTAPFTPPSAAT